MAVVLHGSSFVSYTDLLSAEYAHACKQGQHTSRVLRFCGGPEGSAQPVQAVPALWRAVQTQSAQRGLHGRWREMTWTWSGRSSGALLSLQKSAQHASAWR